MAKPKTRSIVYIGHHREGGIVDAASVQCCGKRCGKTDEDAHNLAVWIMEQIAPESGYYKFRLSATPIKEPNP